MEKQIETLPVQPPLLSVIVTQEQIDKAIPKNSGHCMVADAVKDCFFARHKRKPKNVQVDLQTIRFTDEGKRFIYMTPPTAQRALLQFDQGIKPKPISFRMNRNSVQVLPLKQEYKSEAKRAAEAKAKTQTKKSKKGKPARSKARLVAAQTKGKTHTEVVKIGGIAPPLGVLAGNTRNFGLRMAGLVDEVTPPVDTRRRSQVPIGTTDSK